MNDQLRVGVRPEPSNSEAPTTVVVTGDKLEVLDSADGFLKIRTAKGEEGWVKEIYTTAEIPAVIKLQELTKNSSGDSQKLDTLQKQFAGLEKSNAELNSQLTVAQEDNKRLQVELDKTRIGSTAPATNYTVFWILGLLITAGLGFWGGKQWHQQQVMKRLGGLRI
ncbi:MAG: TIGR04211 family SH3 domain-containing protein [Gammaproteobacteria bacterium]|nr:TIGR04211 family SH3 domain-containing protein [Gammaproteobacteria bacterium]MDH5651926.1 TIGR04211 family SH3 domain-containing protein [Gammaproteobacteria bacterium]